MNLSADDVSACARLARFAFDAEEQAHFREQLDAILTHVSRLQQVDTSMVAETARAGDLVNVWREDAPAPSIGARVALRAAPERMGDYFVVGAIQEQD